jgi:hypothetical protein
MSPEARRTRHEARTLVQSLLVLASPELSTSTVLADNEFWARIRPRASDPVLGAW